MKNWGVSNMYKEAFAHKIYAASTNRFSIRQFITYRSVMLFSVLLFFSGCTVTPRPLSDGELEARVQTDLERIDGFNEAIRGPITMYEAMARALKFNLDYRVEWTRRVLAETELTVSRFDMLPKLVANIDFNSRSNHSGASSMSLLSGEESLEPSTSQEKEIQTSKLELSWNVLDFGLSYYRARQLANEVLIAAEERHKVIHRLLQNVRTAYWRAVSAERIYDRLAELKKDVEVTIMHTDDIIEERLQMPITTLRKRSKMLELKNQISELENDLRVAKTQLAALMNVRDPNSFDVVIPERENDLPMVRFQIGELERVALKNRPELRQIDYRKRIAQNKAKTALLGLLPSLNFSASSNYTSNKYVYNNDWVNTSASVSWDLLRLLSYGSHKRKKKIEEDLLEASSLSLSMAVLLQVNVSMARYIAARDQFYSRAMHYETQSALGDQLDKMHQSDRIGRQEYIEESMNVLLSELRYDKSMSDLQTAYSNVVSAVGLDPKLMDIDQLSLPVLAMHVKSLFGDI